jgi:transcriptional regulator with XRE-family HTH domain
MSDMRWFYEELGRRLRKARRAADLTQEAVGRRVGLSRTSITNIERGAQHISAHQLVELAAAVRVTPAKLLPEQRPPHGEDGPPEELLEGLEDDVRAWVRRIIATANTGGPPHGDPTS